MVARGILLRAGARGELLFAQCSGCHVVADGRSHGIGPDLRGVHGRKIAGAPGYSYSVGLSEVPGTWTDEKLNEFLEHPQRFATGTSMAVEGIPSAEDRRAIIEYLKSRD